MAHYVMDDFETLTRRKMGERGLSAPSVMRSIAFFSKKLPFTEGDLGTTVP